jgi:type III secretory pathway component EscR
MEIQLKVHKVTKYDFFENYFNRRVRKVFTQRLQRDSLFISLPACRQAGFAFRHLPAGRQVSLFI